jgi:hypothetical protein
MRMFKRIPQRLASICRRALGQGWSESKVAWSAAWGVTVGLFPIYGVTTATLAAVGWLAKLNHAVLQGFNYLVGPLKLALIFPYIRLGEWMFRPERAFTLSLVEFSQRFRDAPWETLRAFAWTFAHAVSGWLLSAPFIVLAVFALARLTLRGGRAARNLIVETSA